MSRRSGAVIAACAAALAVAVAVPLVAFGDGKPRLPKPEYSRSVTAIFIGLGERFRRAGAGASETSASLRSMKSGLERAAARLGALRPQKNVEREHAVLVAATRDYASQVDLVGASVDYGDPITIASHLREVTAPAVINRAIRDLGAKGYRIPVRVRGVR
jgi:hypothetical protein